MLMNGRERRAVVTGAAGFVGSHLTDRLLGDGWGVVGVDNLSTGRRVNVEHLAGHPGFELVEANVEEWEGCEGRLDWIFHFASPASPPRYQADPIRTLRVNGEGTHRLLELAHSRGAGFFYASTSEVYGDPGVHPQVEGYRGNVSCTGPRSMYDEGKRYGEAMTLAHHRTSGVDVRIIRIFNTYGPRMAPDDGRVISNFISQALRGEPLTVYGDGSQTRSFQYVSDLVDAVCELMACDFQEPVNLGNPQEVTILEVAEAIARSFGGRDIVHRPLPVDDPTRRKPDTTLARSLVDWRPRVSLDDGLAKTIAFFEREFSDPAPFASVGRGRV